MQGDEALWLVGSSIGLLVFLLGFALALSSFLNALMANRVYIRESNWGLREYRLRFETWISIPLLGLGVAFVPGIASYFVSEYGFTAGLNVFLLAALVVIFLGFFLGLVRWDAQEDKLEEFESFGPLYATIEEYGYENLSATQRGDLRRNMSAIAARLDGKSPKLQRLSDPLVAKDAWLTSRHTLEKQDVAGLLILNRSMCEEFEVKSRRYRAILSLATAGAFLFIVCLWLIGSIDRGTWGFWLLQGLALFLYALAFPLVEMAMRRMACFNIRHLAAERSRQKKLMELIASHSPCAAQASDQSRPAGRVRHLFERVISRLLP